MLLFISSIIVTNQIKNDPRPRIKVVKASWLATPKLSGPPLQMMNIIKDAQVTMQTKNTLKVMYCSFFMCRRHELHVGPSLYE